MRLEAYAHNKQFPAAREMILDALGLDADMIPRIRAVYIGDDGPIVHTRTGGGNREQYDTVEKYIKGEYGIDNHIKEYKNPPDWMTYTAEELKKNIRGLEKQKKKVLTTMAYTNDYLRASEYYIRDEDDDFDSTYADFFYRMPPGLEDRLKEAKYL